MITLLFIILVLIYADKYKVVKSILYILFSPSVQRHVYYLYISTYYHVYST